MRRYKAVFRNPYALPVLVGVCVDFHPCSFVTEATKPEWMSYVPPRGEAESPYLLAGELLEAVAFTLPPMLVRVEFRDEEGRVVAECDAAEGRPCAHAAPPVIDRMPLDPWLPAAAVASAAALYGLRSLWRRLKQSQHGSHVGPLGGLRGAL